MMIRCYAIADQTEWHREPVDDRNLDSDVGLLAQSLGRVDSRWPGADDRDDKGFGLDT